MWDHFFVYELFISEPKFQVYGILRDAFQNGKFQKSIGDLLLSE